MGRIRNRIALVYSGLCFIMVLIAIIPALQLVNQLQAIPGQTPVIHHVERFGLALALLFLVFLLVGYWWVRRLLAPLDHITTVTQDIADGDLRLRVPYWGSDEYGVISGAINSLTTRLLLQMDNLDQERSKVQGIIERMASGVLVVDKSGVISVANQAASRILNCPYEDMIGHTHLEVTNSLRISEMIDTVLIKGSPQHKEVVVTDSTDTNVEVYVSPISGRNGGVSSVVTVLHDVTQFRRLEKMRTEFVANVSHELRTPITAVQGFAETLLDGALNEPEVAHKFVRIIHEESERLRRLVVDLLELSKIESGHSVFKYANQDINIIVQATVRRLEHEANQHGISLHIHTPPNEVTADIAQDRISQVLVNLIGNAIAYTPAPGTIDVSVEDHGSSASIAVKDTGIGIPAADLPHIFERFYRVDKDRSRRTGGTGLGLAIVKHIVENHHGKLTVKSEVGRGTTFTVTIPKRQAAAKPEQV